MATIEMILDARNVVGESIIWSAQEQAVYWVDIVGSRIHRLVPAVGQHDSWMTPGLATSIGLRREGGFIVGLRHRVVLWNPGEPFVDFAVPEPGMPTNRLNEGVVAPDGSYWVGTMQDNIAADGSPRPMTANTGAIYRISPTGLVDRLTPNEFGITNTMIWPLTGGFVTADTRKNEFYRYELEGPGLGSRRVLSTPDLRGGPDGSAQDSMGAIINARVGGGALAILSADGDLQDLIDMPCSQPTSCAFGGPEMKTLFVTSARFGISEQRLATQPMEGGLFALETSSPGLPTNLFG